MAKEAFKYDSYDLWLDVDVTGEVAGSVNTINGPQVRTRNQNIWFPPIGDRLYGMWRANDEANKRVNGALSQAVNGELPGHRVLVDTKNRHVKIIHRLTLPENAQKVEALKALAETDEFFNAKFNALPRDIDHGPLTNDDDWANWLYSLRRCVDHGTMKIIKGKENLPQEQECLRIGNVTRSAGAYLPTNAEQMWRLKKVKEGKIPVVSSEKS